MTESSVVRKIALEAHVASWVVFGRGCVVHPFALVGRLPSQSAALARRGERAPFLIIGDDTEIGPHAIIYGGSDIGRQCLIGDAANIREGVKIGDRCVIGAGTSVLYDAWLGDDVKVMGGSHITGGMRIGNGTFVGVNVTTCNDRRREIVDYQFAGADPPHIGERCVIGSGATILAGVSIGDGAVIGAGALVTSDVPAGATVLGAPARWSASPPLADVRTFGGRL